MMIARQQLDDSLFIAETHLYVVEPFAIFFLEINSLFTHESLANIRFLILWLLSKESFIVGKCLAGYLLHRLDVSAISKFARQGSC